VALGWEVVKSHLGSLVGIIIWLRDTSGKLLDIMNTNGQMGEYQIKNKSYKGALSQPVKTIFGKFPETKDMVR